MNVPNVKHFRHKVIQRVKHHVQKISYLIYEKGDPDFVDERKKPTYKEPESFFDSLFHFLKI